MPIASLMDGTNAGPDEGHGEDIESREDAIEGELVDPEPTGRSGRVSISTEFRGPLPPPQILQGYEEIMPGLTEKIVEQWQAETAHRHKTVDYANETDRLALNAFVESERRGQYIGLGGLALVVAVAIVAMATGETEIGGLALLLGAGPAAVWALRRNSSQTDAPAPTDLANPEGPPQATSQ